MKILFPVLFCTMVLFVNSLALPTPTLKYFDARGAAELVRIIAKIGKYEFVDERFPIKLKEGGGFETPEFNEAKATGIMRMNMNRAPVLVLSPDLVIGQSKSIERYLAKKCNMLGHSDEECALIDCITENIRDIREKWGKIRSIGGMGANPEKDAAMKKFYEEGELKELLEKLDKSLTVSNNSEVYAVGNTLSYADVSIWFLLHEVFDNKEAVRAVSENCPTLNKISNNVANNANLQAWLAERPQTMF